MSNFINHDIVNEYLWSIEYKEDLNFRNEFDLPIDACDEYITTDCRYEDLDHIRFFIYFLCYSYYER